MGVSQLMAGDDSVTHNQEKATLFLESQSWS